MSAFCRDLCDGLIGNCRNCMQTPITRTKIYWGGGISLFVILFIIILCVAIPSGSPDPRGRDALSYGISNGLFILEGTENATVSSFDKTKFDEIIKNNVIRIQMLGVATECSSQFKDAVALSLDGADFLSRLVPSLGQIQVARSLSDVTGHYDNGVKSALLALRGGQSIDNRLPLLRTLYLLGFRILSLVSSSDCSTPWAKSATNQNNITHFDDNFRKAVIQEMNRLGMIIDIAGLDTDLQKNILDDSSAPVVAMNVGFKSINNNSMNLDESILDKFVKNKGVLMLSTDCNLIAANVTNCKEDDFTNQLRHAKEKGILVSLGGKINAASNSPLNSSRLNEYFDKLLNSDFNMAFLKNLAKDNVINLLKAVEKVSKDKMNSKENGAMETFFDWTKISGNDGVCYSNSHGPGPTSAPATQATSAPPAPTTQATSAPPAPTTQATPAPTPKTK